MCHHRVPAAHKAYPFSFGKRSNTLGRFAPGRIRVAVPDNRSFVAGIAARYGSRLRRFLSVRLRNAADVPDLAQEVFLRLLRVDGYENIRSPEAYLFTIASHVIQQHAVRRSSEPVSVDIAEVFSELRTASSDDPPDQVAHAQQLANSNVFSTICRRAWRRRWCCTGSPAIRSRRSAMSSAFRAKPPRNIWHARSNTAEICARPAVGHRYENRTLERKASSGVRRRGIGLVHRVSAPATSTARRGCGSSSGCAARPNTFRPISRFPAYGPSCRSSDPGAGSTSAR
jgi:DNA-directed RNA polymerase specialized sigma24 family protein